MTPQRPDDHNGGDHGEAVQLERQEEEGNQEELNINQDLPTDFFVKA